MTNSTNTRQRPSIEKPWMKYFERVNITEPVPACTIYEYFKQSIAHNPNGYGLNYYGKKVTHAEMIRQIELTAAAYAALGVKQGDTVSFVSVAVPETIFSIYALNKLGATANLIDPRMDVESIRRMIVESGSRITVSINLAYPKIDKIMDAIAQDKILIQSAARSLPFIKKVAVNIAVRQSIPYSDKILKWDTFLAGGAGVTTEAAPYVKDAVVGIAYTGGTTGFPKGVMFTNDSINAVAYNFKYAGLATKSGESFLGIIPVFTSYGLVCGMHMPLCMDVELMPIPKFDPTKFGKLVRDMRPNHIISTPAFYELMMDSAEVKGLDLSFLVTLGSGGDTMNEGIAARLSQFMKDHNIRYPLAQGYGLSEMSAAVSFCVNDIYKEFSVGIPSVTTTVGIFDPDTGEEMGYCENGEVCVTGPSIMKGYYNRPEETANVMHLHDDGRLWIHTGDLGYIDEDGFIFIKGRTKRMITRFDGHKVFPVNIESLVAARDTVHNCCVIGVGDRGHSQGQYPFVFVDLVDGIDAEAERASIYAECQELLEERGRPVGVMVVDEIPLTGAGKNDYRALEEKFSTYDYTADTY